MRLGLAVALSLVTSVVDAADFAAVPVAERSPLPRFDLQTLEGKQFVSTEVRGKVTVINFWATWCVPCMQELTALSAYHRKVGEGHLNMIGIATDGPETLANVRSVVRRKHWSYLILRDPDGSVVARLNPRGSIPFTLFVDRAGRIAYRHAGYVSGDENRSAQLIAALLAESGS